MTDLILTREFPPQDGGIAAVAYEMAAHWSRQGKNVIVLCWKSNPKKCLSSFRDSDQIFKIIRIHQPAFRVFQILNLVFHLFKLHTQAPIRRVWATSWNFSGLACAIFEAFTRVPFVVLTHGYEVSKPALTSLDQLLSRVALGRARRVFAVSRYTRGLVMSLAPALREVVFIPNGIDTSKYRPDVPGVADFKNRLNLNGKKILLTVARLFPRKGHDLVLEALPEVIQKIPDVHYLIAGEGPEKQRLKEKVSSLGLGAFVTFAGFVPDQDLPACYACCDIFVLPNRLVEDPEDPWVGDFEGFGVVFIEASASGKPVIAGNTGGAPDAVVDGSTGFLLPPDDPKKLANKLVELLQNPEFSKKVGAQGRTRAEKELNWPVILNKYEDSFENHPAQ